MQVTETKSEGLKHEFKVVVGAADLRSKIDDRLQELSRQVRLPGFRPGKVPLPVLKQRFGPSVLGEVLERTVQDSSQQALMERGLRPALTPKIEITSYAENADLEYTLAVETLPAIETINFRDLRLERLKVEVSEEDLQKALTALAERYRKSEPVTEDRPAEKGDVVVIDFKGQVDGKSLPGMEGKDQALELGSNQFIPGFEDQLVGHGKGAQVQVAVRFPDDYGNPELAGKDAGFEVTVKELRKPIPLALDDALAKDMGMEDLDTLTRAVKREIEQNHARTARTRLKRSLLDALADRHSFPAPQGMVDLEFEAIWKNVEEARKQGEDDPTLKGKSEDDLKSEFRGIAERRVKLGLLLSEVGRSNNLDVSAEEVNRAVNAEARRYPGQERKVVEYFQKTPEALAQIRAPLFEDKVVDFILEMAQIDDRIVPTEELYRDPEAAPAAG